MEGAGGGFRTSFMSKGAHLQAVSSHNRIRSLLNGITATTQVTFRLIRALRRTRSHTWPASSSASINLTPNVDTNANHSHDTGFFGPDFPVLSFGALNPYFLSLSWPTLSPGLPFFSPLAAASQQRGTEHLIVCEEAHRQCFYWRTALPLTQPAWALSLSQTPFLSSALKSRSPLGAGLTAPPHTEPGSGYSWLYI